MRDFLENRPHATPSSFAQEKPAASPLLHACLKPLPAQDQTFPKLELQHDPDGKIKEIRITCQCGERIVLQCTY